MSSISPHEQKRKLRFSEAECGENRTLGFQREGREVILSLDSTQPNGSDSGQSYVVFGGTELGATGTLELSSLDGNNGFALNGVDSSRVFPQRFVNEDRSGFSVSNGEDINGDGIDDLIIGAPNGNTYDYSGRSYVVFGNTSPELDLNGETSGIDFATIFVSSPVSIVDSANLTLSDPNNTILASATVTITNLLDGTAEILAADTSSTNITASYDETTGILLLSGEDTLANYQQVLRTVTYNNTATTPDPTERIIEFVVDDGQVHSNTSTVANTTLTISINGTSGNDLLIGTPSNNLINGFAGNDLLIGNKGDDILKGGGDRDRFAITEGDGIDTITDFGAVGKGGNPPQEIIDEVDTLQFFGEGLTAKNMLLTQKENDLEITFAGVKNSKIILQNFALEDLENRSNVIGNILFDGQQEIQDNFDVLDADSMRSTVFDGNTVTFLNDLDNTTQGFEDSNDVINGQGGSDILLGRSGDDLLRGGNGDDVLLDGGAGDDLLDGGAGNDSLLGGANADRFVLREGDGVDTIFDYRDGTDSFLLADGLAFEDLTITQEFGQTVISVTETETEELAFLLGVNATDLGAEDFSTLI